LLILPPPGNVPFWGNLFKTKFVITFTRFSESEYTRREESSGGTREEKYDFAIDHLRTKIVLRFYF